MRDDRQELRQVKLVESVLDRGRDGEVGKLDEKVVLLIDRVVPGLRVQRLEVFVTQMEVTAGGQNQAISQAGLEFTLALLYQFGMEWEAVAGMGCAHDMGDSIGDGHFRHLEGFFERIRSVIQAGQDVAMDINHRTWRVEDKGRLGLETTKKSPLLEREQDNRRVCILVMRLLAWICVASMVERAPS